MKHIKKFESFSVDVNEGLFDRLFGKEKVSQAAHDSVRGQGFSHRGKDEANYIMFDGQKFYDGDIEYADVNDTGKIPRVEGGKLVIANPIWSE